MIDSTVNSAAQGLPISLAKPRPVFKMITSDRMAGSVPAWLPGDSPKDQSLAALANTAHKAKFSDDLTAAQNAEGGMMAYGPQQTTATANDENADEPFGFGDLVDIVNPLQHIPLVSNLYRAITGDHIRPSADIIGGAIYGGIGGVASGLANVIMEKETGKTVMGHAVAMIEGNDTGNNEVSTPASLNEIATASGTADQPLQRLAEAETKTQSDIAQNLPGTALSFADLGAARPVAHTIPAKPERYAAMYKFNE